MDFDPQALCFPHSLNLKIKFHEDLSEFKTFKTVHTFTTDVIMVAYHVVKIYDCAFSSHEGSKKCLKR